MGLANFLKKLINGSQDDKTDKSSVVVKKILVVDDDEYLRDFYFELLSNEGFDVIKAENGEMGFEIVQSHKPNLVLLDLMMPVMDGKTMLHKLREIPEFKTLPVIVLTNAGDADNMQQTKVFDNASDFLIKANINPEILLNKVRTLV